ncbi:hypothetical protein EDB19DRAFT_1762203, partial [Suillus lakei]
MPCTTDDNDSDKSDGFLRVLNTNGSITVSMFVIIFTETFLVTCFLYPELAFLLTMSLPANEPQFETVLGHGLRVKNTARLTESITVELEGSQDVPAVKSKPRRSKKTKTRATQNRFDGLTIEGDLDDEGSDFTSPSTSRSDTSTSDSDQETDVIEITNEEYRYKDIDAREGEASFESFI